MEIRYAAKLSLYNKTAIAQCQKVGCYHCLMIFDPKEVKEWTDEGQTAICPFCAVDAVLAETDNTLLTRELLTKLRDYWL